MAQQQIPDLDITKPETILIRIALIRNAIRSIDDELAAYSTLIAKQLRDEAKRRDEEAAEKRRKELEKETAKRVAEEASKPRKEVGKVGR